MRTQKVIAVFLGILVVVVLGTVLYQMRSIVLPFMVALFLAYLLEPIVRLLRRLHVPLFLAAFMALFLAFTVLGLAGTLFYTSVQTFVANYGRYEPKVRTLIMEATSHLAVLPPEWQMAELLKWLTPSSVAKMVLASLGAFVTFLGHLLLSLFFTIFILIGQQRLPRRIHRAFSEEDAQRILQVMQHITVQIQTYLGTKALISVATGGLVYLALLLLRMEFAQLWGALALILNFIPHVGSILAALPPILLAVLQFETLMPAVWVAIAFLVIHLGFGLIEPRLMGQRLDLSPLLVVISLAFWGWLWGIIGMVLAVPILVTIKIVCEHFPPLRVLSVFMSGR